MKTQKPNYWKALFKKPLWWLTPFAFIKRQDWIFEPDTLNERAERNSTYGVNIIVSTFYCVAIVVIVGIALT